MHIVVDDTVSLADELLGPLGRLTVLPPREITRQRLMDADALVVRSTVRVDRDLLAGTPVRFVGTATSGADHVDEVWLAEAGVAFAAAPGCNAQAVAEYIVAALLILAEKQGWAPAGRTLGVVGVGHVGGRVGRLARVLGMNVVECDPPLARRTGDPRFVDLPTLLAASDIVTLHVPLLRDGPDATHHLLNAETISAMRNGRNGAVLINSARGGVVETAAAVAARRAGRLSGLVIDVWEAEPVVDAELLSVADIMTPHIAGHSVEGKENGTRMIAEALARFFGLQPPNSGPAAGRPGAPVWPLNADGASSQSAFAALTAFVAGVCDLKRVDADLRSAVAALPAGRGANLEECRKRYPLRREFASYSVDAIPEAYWGLPGLVEALARLGFRTVRQNINHNDLN